MKIGERKTTIINFESKNEAYTVQKSNKSRYSFYHFIIQILANDKPGKLRESYQEPLPDTYYQAFEAILQDPNQELMVLDDEEEGILGTFQMSFIRYLTYQGGLRAQIEAVRLREEERG